ncbi:hypothetical protein TrRE_jg4792 [Triparma retinervis]|uniref:Cyclin N-terminal domain-containing protein n=1 Tax=Triparma retinervis TaxID=2557542 RepID=A0A9W6ZGT4_9STRA|nr:hypothetical protein TrRE_jg4792 [Triparma retinervis]
MTTSMRDSKQKQVSSFTSGNLGKGAGSTKASMLNPIKPKKKAAKDPKMSENEKVHQTVRQEVSKHILSGTSLLCPTPSLGEEVDSEIMGKVRNFRTTLFHHVALPAPLPSRLSKEDVSEFKSISIWEEHLRQTKPWLENQKVSDKASLVNGLQTEQAKRRNTDPLTQPMEAFQTPRSPRRNEREEAKVDRSLSADASNQALIENMDTCEKSKPKKKVRGRTFVSLPVAKRDEKLRRKSVHKPDVQNILHGLSILLSYLIEEPPEKYIKKQSWDIFSVPGDKTKVIAPITAKEREKNAGDTVIPSEHVRECLVSLFKICQWTSECHIIAFILIIRLINMSNGKVALHRYNWQCLLCVSLMISQKLWDDVSLNNVDFPQVWRMVAPKGGEMDLKDVNFMEREFLSILGFEVTVNLRLYTSCYYDVMALAMLHSDPSSPSMSSALSSYFGKSAVARYSMSSIHVLKGPSSIKGGSIMKSGQKSFDDDPIEDGDEEEEDQDTVVEESFVFKTEEEIAKENAKRKFARRHTADVLMRTPPRQRRELSGR